MHLSLHNVKSVEFEDAHLVRDSTYARTIRIEHEHGIDLITLFSDAKGNLYK